MKSLFKNQWVKLIVFSFGSLFLILGVVGIFLPLLPTTPFLLLAAWCFYHSSPRAHDWIYRQPYLGVALKDWEKRGAISKKSKTIATLMIAASIVVISLRPIDLWLKLTLGFVLIAVSTFILTRPNQ